MKKNNQFKMQNIYEYMNPTGYILINKVYNIQFLYHTYYGADLFLM